MREHLNRVSKFWYQPSLGLLLVRVGAGSIFLIHGWEKLQHLTGVASFFVSLGLPAWMAVFVSLVEVVGGVMLIFGVATRVAGAALGINMLVAIFLTGVGRGFHAHEFEMLLGAVSLGVALAGSGKYRLTHIFEHDR